MAKIKICGLYRREDICYVNKAMPDFAGFVIEVPKSRRNVSAEQVRTLRKGLDPGIKAVGVFVNPPQKLVRKLYEDRVIDILQLHGEEDEDYIASLRLELPAVEIWKAFTIKTGEDVKNAFRCTADRILLDSGKGTGTCFDWSVVSNVDVKADEEKRSFILAGGLRPENIEMAVRSLNPWAVDLSSGVETEGKKDENKILAAVLAARRSEQ